MSDDLAQIRTRLEPKRRTVGYVVLEHNDFRAIMDGLDTLAAAEQARDAQAARLADIWLLVDLWDAGTEGGLETLERLVALKETGHAG